MKMSRFLTRSYSFLSLSLLFDAWRDADACAAATGDTDVVGDVEYGRSVFWLADGWIEEVAARHAATAPAAFREFLARGLDAGLTLTAVARRLFEEPARRAVPSVEGLGELSEFKRAFQRNAAFILVTHPIAKAVETRLLEILKRNGVPPAGLDQALLDLSVTRRSNAAEEESFDLLVLQRQAGRPAFDLESALVEHARRHAYVKYREPFSRGYTLEDFRERLKGKLELPAYFEPHAPLVSRLGASDREWVELQEEMVFYRTFRTERSYEALYYLERSLAVLEEANGLPPHELSYYGHDELTRFLSTGEHVEPEATAERRRDFAIHLHGGAVSVLTGRAFDDWAAATVAEEPRPAKEVRGLRAFRGLATGRARVLKSAQDQEGVLEGDVLIVPMTTPDFLPSLQKAAAFVTDEGGVICHAAIIARELKKPCVIGTKRATALFADGDLVEVDGFTGIVRLVPGPA